MGWEGEVGWVGVGEGLYCTCKASCSCIMAKHLLH